MYDFTDRHNLYHVWRVRNPTNRQFIFRQKSLFLQRCLDHIFISNELQENVVNEEVLPSVNSDYSPIYLKLAENTSLSTGWSYWKFNNSFLKKLDYINAMRTEIEKIKNTDRIDLMCRPQHEVGSFKI